MINFPQNFAIFDNMAVLFKERYSWVTNNLLTIDNMYLNPHSLITVIVMEDLTYTTVFICTN